MISFDGLRRYIGVDIRMAPGQEGVLIFSLAAVAGLIVSLYVSRRRLCLRAGTNEDGRTMIEYGLLARGEDHRLAAEAAVIRALLVARWNLAESHPAATATVTARSQKEH